MAVTTPTPHSLTLGVLVRAPAAIQPIEALRGSIETYSGPLTCGY